MPADLQPYKTFVKDRDYVTKQNLLIDAIQAALALSWDGAWVTANAYAAFEIVDQSGTNYICVTAHTSGVFATDLSAGKWELFNGGGPGINDLATGTVLTLLDTGLRTDLNSDTNTVVGMLSGQALTSSTLNNTFYGYRAGRDQAGSTDDNNTFIGNSAGLLANGSVSGINTGVGSLALSGLTTGLGHTAMGINASDAVTTVGNNAAFGRYVLAADIAGSNSAFGAFAGDANVTGVRLTSVGYLSASAQAGITDDDNTFVGFEAGQIVNGSSVGQNSGFGSKVFDSLTTGNYNTAIGKGAGNDLTTGSYNTLLGRNALAGSASGVDRIVIGSGITGTTNNRVHIGNATNHIYANFNSSATWTYTSDEQMKNFRGDSPLGLAFINMLETKEFTWKSNDELISEGKPDFARGDGHDPAKLNHGLGAQSVKAAMMAMGVTEFAGWDADEETGLQAIGESAFVYPLIRAVNELSAKVNVLETQ